ncbi:hypothetical protein [Microbulbifer sp. THAF38]|uniref:hypothetical protein n=1 Tax=Microbulbifer sp. THAF38 TaxID=2587856 RepID=UPI0012690F20|nr:hypothetical protein [Microbulbifer sp. THAF38]QFT57105.1 hypothetical protein FIU95_21370 [Microbulbifer sp. THAF38]
MLQRTLDIGGHMIMAKVYRVIGDHNREDKEMLDAMLIAKRDGNHHATIRSLDEPGYLVHYPELRNDWENGYAEGVEYLEIRQCSTCQDPDIWMCSIHDH